MYNSYTDKEKETLKVWLEEHDKTCRYAVYSGAIGGRLTYCLTPTSIGCINEIKCACGESNNFTDYESW